MSLSTRLPCRTTAMATGPASRIAVCALRSDLAAMSVVSLRSGKRMRKVTRPAVLDRDGGEFVGSMRVYEGFLIIDRTRVRVYARYVDK
jgi:hypothetical protein